MTVNSKPELDAALRQIDLPEGWRWLQEDPAGGDQMFQRMELPELPGRPSPIWFATLTGRLNGTVNLLVPEDGEVTPNRVSYRVSDLFQGLATDLRLEAQKFDDLAKSLKDPEADQPGPVMDPDS